LLSSFQIRKNGSLSLDEGTVYSMEFLSSGHRYRCPLAHFQPRTQAVGQTIVFRGLPFAE